MPVQTTIKNRRDTAANWSAANPILAAGEIGYESNTGYAKIGDGSTAWNSLARVKSGYADTAGSASSATTATNATNAINQWVFTKNSTGATIAKGVPVYASSADGTNLLISKASNTSEVTSSKVLGLTYASMSNNASNYVVTEGLLGGLNTSAATIGDSVWLGENGALLYGLANKPVAPAHMVSLGVVTRVSATVGEIFVKVQNGFELHELHDVLIVGEADGDILAYDEASGLWKNSAGGFAPTQDPTFTIGSLTQVIASQDVWGGYLNPSTQFLNIISSSPISGFDYPDKLSFVGTSGLDDITFTVEYQPDPYQLDISFPTYAATLVDNWLASHFDVSTADIAAWYSGQQWIIQPSELSTLDGAAGNIQLQLAGKASTSHTHTLSQITDYAAPAESISPFLLMGA